MEAVRDKLVLNKVLLVQFLEVLCRNSGFVLDRSEFVEDFPQLLHGVEHFFTFFRGVWFSSGRMDARKSTELVRVLNSLKALLRQRYCISHDSRLHIEVNLADVGFFHFLRTHVLLLKVDVQTWVIVDLKNPSLKLMID